MAVLGQKFTRGTLYDRTGKKRIRRIWRIPYLTFFASEILKCPVFNVFGVFTYLRFFIQILKCLVFNVFGVFTYLRFFKILKCPVFSVFGVFTYLRFYKISKWLVTHILLLVIALPGHHQGDVQAGSSSASDSGAMLAINITRQHLVQLCQCYSYPFLVLALSGHHWVIIRLGRLLMIKCGNSRHICRRATPILFVLHWNRSCVVGNVQLGCFSTLL